MKQPSTYSTHRRFERWMDEANPHTFDSLPYWNWRINVLRERTNSLARSSMRWMVVALILMALSLVLQVARIAVLP